VRIWDVDAGECIRVLTAPASVRSAVFNAAGDHIVAGGDWESLDEWDIETGALVQSVPVASEVKCLAADPTRRLLVSGHGDSLLWSWDLERLSAVREFAGHADVILSVACAPNAARIASTSYDLTCRIWDAANGELLHTLPFERVSQGQDVGQVTFSPDGASIAAIAGNPALVNVWNADTGTLERTMEGHLPGIARAAAFSPDGHVLATLADDGYLRLWNSLTGAPLDAIDVGGRSAWTPTGAFHPSRPRLASPGADDSGEGEHASIYVFDLDIDQLLAAEQASVAYASAKIVLVGDSGVGKTGLGWRLAHRAFVEQSSTHGQQFWTLEELRTTRSDGADCEAILWDLAGQPDYRLIHALFLDDADLALVLFDPTRDDDPMHGVEYWLKQLGQGPAPGDGARPRTEILLVAARSDRGTGHLTAEDIAAYCRQRGIHGYVVTSARTGEGVEQLIAEMRALLPWERSAVTVTTEVFKRLKDEVLALKERRGLEQRILRIDDVRQVAEASGISAFSDAELATAIDHLSKHGYVTRLTTSRGEPRVLLAPDVLNNLASSIVLEARRNPRGLGSLEEEPLLAGEYAFPELQDFAPEDRSVLLDSAVVMFLRHNLCFRETDPLSARGYLVFPGLINLRQPSTDDAEPYEEGPAYTAVGQTENVYASLVVLLGYTNTFARTHQWRDHARYVVGDGLVCGFRQQATRDGELDFALYYGTSVDEPIRRLFQSLFESFLIRRHLSVRRFEPVACGNGHRLNRAVVQEQLAAGEEQAFCSRCGAPVDLRHSSVVLDRIKDEAEVRSQAVTADRRAQFEELLFRFMTYVSEAGFPAPRCFLTYAWGVPAHEQWVRERLAPDLAKAGVDVLLDRWDNARIGSSVTRFVERVATAEKVIVVGTPEYRRKYDNDEPVGGYVVAAEGDLVGRRLVGSEAAKRSVLPLLLDGEESTSFPALLQGRVFADFREEEDYFLALFDVLFSLYNVPEHDAVAEALRDTLAQTA
jgi:WD40 repeat protein